MITVIVPEIVPLAQLGMVSVAFVAGDVLGPVLGGVIVDRGSWGWMFVLKYVYLFSMYEMNDN
jgi:MFS family permease